MRPAGILILIVCTCLVLLVLGGERLLLISLPGGVPFGTFLAAVALVAGSVMPRVVSRKGSLLWRVSSLVIIAAILWLPLGIVLSGNPALSFVNDASDSALFWRFTGALAVIIIFTISWAGIDAFHRRRDQISPE